MEQGLLQVSDTSELIPIVQRVFDENPRAVQEFRAGKEKAAGFLVGQAMRASGGAGNPQTINRLVREMPGQ